MHSGARHSVSDYSGVDSAMRPQGRTHRRRAERAPGTLGMRRPARSPPVVLFRASPLSSLHSPLDALIQLLASPLSSLNAARSPPLIPSYSRAHSDHTLTKARALAGVLAHLHVKAHTH